MLLRFQVENFLSFNERQNFSMIASQIRNKPEHVFIKKNVELLNLSAIYGANASGKTNLIKSINLFKHIVINGVPANITQTYFKENTKNKNKPTIFEVEFIKNDFVYAYGIKMNLNKRKIEGEWLYQIFPNKNDETIIFEREINNEEFSIKFNETLITEEDKDRFNFITNDLKNNFDTLLLNEMNRNKNIDKDSSLYSFKEVFDWFLKDLKIYFPNDHITKFDYVIDKRKDNNNNIDKIISSFDTGITDISLQKIEKSEIEEIIPFDLISNMIEDIRNKNKDVSDIDGVVARTNKDFFQLSNITSNDFDVETIKLKHGINNITYDFREESDGTRRLFDLLEILLVEDENKVFIVDELDRSLHPNLTYKFIEFFYEIAAKKNIQLIFTTHESKIMDLNLVRQDEIWFIEKNKENESKIYSLENFKERYDKRIEKAYLDGRYGAIPVFSSFETYNDENEVY